MASELLSISNGPLLNLYFSTEVEEEPEEPIVENVKKVLVEQAEVSLAKTLKFEESPKEDLETDWVDEEEQNVHIKSQNKENSKKPKRVKKRGLKKIIKKNIKHKDLKKKESQEESKVECGEKEEKDLNPTESAHDIEEMETVPPDNATIVSDEGSNGTCGKYELIYMLFSFIDVEPEIELNELLAGYFRAAALALINGKPKEMAEFLESNQSVIYNLAVHSNNKSIAEVLCKVLTMEDDFISNPVQFNGTCRDVLNKLLYHIENPNTDIYSIRQFAQTFCDLTEQSKLIPVLCCTMDLFKRIFGIALNPNTEIAAAGIQILTKFLTMENSQVKVYIQEHLLSTSTFSDELLKCIKDLFINFKERLLENKGTQINQCGVKISPLGIQRLKIIECLYAFMNLSLFPIADQMNQLEFSKVFCDLFLRFPFNSVLHALLYSIFKYILDSNNKSLLNAVRFYNQPLVHSE